MKGLAAYLGLDLPSFYSCLDTDKYLTRQNGQLTRIEEDIKSGDQLGVQSVPTFLIAGPIVDPKKGPYEPPNGRIVSHALTFSALRDIIEQELAKAK